MQESVIRSSDVARLSVSRHCDFVVVKVIDDDGRYGWGEATLRDQANAVLICIEELSSMLLGKTICDAEKIVAQSHNWKRGFSWEVAVNSFESALIDLRARSLGLSAVTLIGGARRDAVEYYANLNKGITDRSVAGWVARAASATKFGFSALKIAPFDNVSRNQSRSGFENGVAEGLEIVRAVRDEVGKSIRIMVDCHWRFDVCDAARLVRELAPVNIEWLEAPIAETPSELAAWRDLKLLANANGMKLSGGEYHRSLEEVLLTMKSNAVDVINPDIRFIGIRDTLVVARLAESLGIQFSPHNPLGPVMDAASHAVCLAAPAVHSLEIQFENCEKNWSKSVSDYEPIQDGMRKASSQPGWGIEINDLSGTTDVPLGTTKK